MLISVRVKRSAHLGTLEVLAEKLLSFLGESRELMQRNLGVTLKKPKGLF